MHKVRWKSELIDEQIATSIFAIKNRAILDLRYSLLKVVQGYLLFIAFIHSQRVY